MQTRQSINDSEIRKLIWQGAIPVVFNMISHEITSLQTPYPLYMMVPRQSYFTLLIDTVRNHFESYVSTFNKDEIWFEYDNQPLKWNMPVGVLYDACMLHNTAGSDVQRTTLSKELPWRVTVHFHSFPSEQLIRIKSDVDIQWIYMNALKEAMYVKCGNTKGIMTLSKVDQLKLWDSVRESKLLEYEEIQKQLSQSSGTIRNLPVRVLTISSDNNNSASFISSHKLYCVDVHSETTIADFVANKLGNNAELYNVVIQGLIVQSDTTLQWLVDNCSHPDHFLYICCIQKQ
jgi:autophagy-related protein 5